MKSKTIIYAVMGLALILLTFSGGYTQALGASTQFNATEVNTFASLFIEEMKIVAGIDTAALVQVTSIGGPTTLKVTPSSLMSNVLNWIFAISEQDDYKDYLVRRPFRAPENATLILEISKSLGADESLTEALDVAAAFSSYYGIELYWSGAITSPIGNYVYKFSGGIEDTQFTTLINEIQSDIPSGFLQAFSSSDVINSPVKTVFIGEAAVEGAIRGVSYVDSDAITNSEGVYTLSTNNLFGDVVSVFDDTSYDKYSVVKFRFPYTINPISISPKTDNVAPQITGKMDWVMQVPWVTRMSSSDFEVSFNIDYDALASAPRVGVNMAYNQDLLNQNGTLQMDYNVTNTGSEIAHNVTISYPLGKDFMKFYSRMPSIWRLRDDVSIDENITIPVDISIKIDVNGDLIHDDNQTMMVFEGWYVYDNGSLVDINSTLTKAVVKTEVVSVTVGGEPYTITTEVAVNSSLGLSQILIDQTTLFLENITVNDYIGDWDALFEAYRDELRDGIEQAADDLFHLLYQEQTIFDFNGMDFEIVSREINIGYSNVTHYFLEATIEALDPGNWTMISWALENIPNESWLLGSMYIHVIDNDDGTKSVGLTTEQHDFYELMRTILGFSDWAGQVAYGRPISFYDYMNDVWISAGARFSYSDPEGFEYFGFSNGINFQIADDEAVINAYVELDALAYKVGDNVTISGYIENTGNLPAEDVYLYLYHGRMDRNWQIADPELFYVEYIGTVAAGEKIEYEIVVEGNSYLGIYPVYAVVEFTSDKGQGPAEVINPFTGEVGYFEGAAEAHEVVISNMAWGLLLPKKEAMEPAFPQPILDVVTNVDIIIPEDAPWEIEVELVITNVGESETHVTINQYYNISELELKSKVTTQGSISNTTFLGMGLISVQGITLAPGDTVTVTMRWMFLTSGGCYLPGAQIIYDSRFENELGDGGDGGTGTVLLSLDGESQEADTWEDYGESTSTGSSAGADIFTGGTEKTRRIGSLDLVFISISSVIVTAIATTIRRKKKL
ncbi:MAG: hypothetical protein ACTSQE_03520 [Candidatus Heimdallarchaeaceae archaeon]